MVGVGELTDLHTLRAADSTSGDKFIAGFSLGLNLATGGLAPNFGKTAKTAGAATEAAQAAGSLNKSAKITQTEAKGLAEGAGAGQTASGKPPHGNTLDDRPATLYEKYDKDGNFQKHGITKHEAPSKRYTKKQIDGGEVRPVERGPRSEMANKERERVETNPGPDNKEPWAGKRAGQSDD